MKKETHSPRGRINLVKMAAEGKISIDDLTGPMELCLGCRACEPACPTNVQYGKILESALSTVSAYRKEYETVKQKTIKRCYSTMFSRSEMSWASSGRVCTGISRGISMTWSKS
ncbi:4Fe-4S binding protein [Rossellomorea sp. H39__3]